VGVRQRGRRGERHPVSVVDSCLLTTSSSRLVTRPEESRSNGCSTEYTCGVVVVQHLRMDQLEYELKKADELRDPPGAGHRPVDP
jgi:hypothetical protein